MIYKADSEENLLSSFIIRRLTMTIAFRLIVNVLNSFGCCPDYIHEDGRDWNLSAFIDSMSL